MSEDLKHEEEADGESPADEDESSPLLSGPTRRGAIGLTLAGLMAGAAAWLGDTPGRARSEMRLRPPGALDEERFLDTCVRCFKCGDACPNGCIQYQTLVEGFSEAWTPYIHARTRGCILCGECARVCPSGALEPFGPEREDWVAAVHMGKARVNKTMCFSFNGRTCGACYQACPLAGQAIKIGVFETPHVQPEHCVGCGLCEQACLHLPQAIRVVPRRS